MKYLATLFAPLQGADFFKRKRRKKLLCQLEKEYFEKTHLDLLYASGKGGLIVNIHGGGFCYGTSLDEDCFSYLLNQKTSMHVIAVNYSLSYKKHFPAQLEEIDDQIKYILNKYPEIDQENIIVIGHSAGGNLAAAMVIKKNRENDYKFRKMILDYPYTELYLPMSERYKKPYNFSNRLLSEFEERYCPGHEKRNNPLVSPNYLNEEEAKKLPKTYLIISDNDRLGQDGLRFEKVLKSGGVDYIAEHTDAVHGYIEIYLRKYHDGDKVTPKINSALKTVKNIINFILN